jgi:superfamily I DNA/RNA helicase
MSEKYLSSLNEKQLEAVQQPAQPVLVLAGPGTGKTLLLISRIVWLIENQGVAPEKILALTFTNKAADEMKARLLNTLEHCGNDLRKYHERMNLNKHFSVSDQDYQKQLVKSLCAPYIRENLETKASAILLSFSNHIMKDKTLPQFAKERYEEYRKHLKKHNLIDFDQIILFTRNLLRDNQDVRSEYQFLFQAILVDEFQDTDPLQYEIIKMLAEKHRHIFVVADDDQSIYSWRGANPENIKKYIEDFSLKQPIFLDINYRSGNKILSSAHKVIEQTERIEPDKHLHVSSDVSDSIELLFFLNEKDEIEFIIKKISSWIQNGVAYGDIAVIYPFHRIGHFLEQNIMNNQIPYQMAEGRSLLDHPLIKKIILFLRLVRNPEDHIALEELTINELGQSLFSYIKHYAQRNAISFRKSLYNLYSGDDHNLNKDSRYKIQTYIAQIANIVNLKSFFNFSQLIDEMISIADQEKFSFLNRFAKKIQDPDEVIDYQNIKPINIEQSPILVYHNQEKICYIASELIRAVTKRPAKSINNLEKKEGLLFELAPYAKECHNITRIPIYSLSNEKRKGCLSNLFKYLQWITSFAEKHLFDRYIVLDLETTDNDPSTCDIVEIAAIKVENNEIVSEFQSLIKPQKEISNIVIAHNGYAFDFAILDRFSKKIEGNKLSNIRLDSLAMARNLFPGQSNSIDALIERFKLKCSSRHRALDDVRILAEIFRELENIKIKLLKRTRLEMFLEFVALGNFVENTLAASEDRIFFLTGARKLLSSYAKIRSKFSAEFNINEDVLISDLQSKLRQLQSHSSLYRNDEHLMTKIKNMVKDYDQMSIDDAIAKFLSYISLNTGQDQLEDIDAISLLTFHAAKGLEFDKVILMGIEDNNMPGFHAMREDIDDDRPISKKVEEQRRLFYVGITRAKTELLLTAVKNRGGWEHRSSSFLKDLDIPHRIINEN